jgi:hypothetical protein
MVISSDGHSAVINHRGVIFELLDAVNGTRNYLKLEPRSVGPPTR